MVFMNFESITKDYYSKWLGVPLDTMNSRGVIFIESSERDKLQVGYSRIFNIYAYKTGSLIIISYSKKLTDGIKKIRQEIHCDMSTEEVNNAIQGVFSTPVRSAIKFCYNKIPSNIDTTNVVKLLDTHYPKYQEFYTTQYPDAEVDNWMEDYFYSISKSESAFGVFIDKKLVSVTDAADMPYMEDKVQEIGINTLPEYRGKGYAKAVSLACIKSSIEKGKCPIWSCAKNNVASEKLAYSVGFRKLADVLTIST
jgi:RimJ/RimL family protein N-acetyltransferase